MHNINTWQRFKNQELRNKIPVLESSLDISRQKYQIPDKEQSLSYPELVAWETEIKINDTLLSDAIPQPLDISEKSYIKYQKKQYKKASPAEKANILLENAETPDKYASEMLSDIEQTISCEPDLSEVGVNRNENIRELYHRYQGKRIHQDHFVGIDFEDNGKGIPTHWAICGLLKKHKQKSINGKRKWYYADKVFKTSGLKLKGLKQTLLSLKRRESKGVLFNGIYDLIYLDMMGGIIDEKKSLIQDRLVTEDGKIISHGTRVIKIVLKTGFIIYDLHNLLWRDCTLKDVIEGLKLNKSGFNLQKQEFVTGRGYEDPLKQCEDDAMATALAMMEIEDYCVKVLKTSLAYTIGTQSMKYYQTHYFYDYWKREPIKDQKLLALEDRSLIGGRSEVFQHTKSTNLKQLDINKAYLSVFKNNKFPDMLSAEYHEDNRWARFLSENKYQGIYHVLVENNTKQRIMALPYRSSNPKEHITYRYGQWWEIYTSDELYDAITKYGYKVLDCKEYVIYRKSKYYFKRFAEFIETEIDRLTKEGNNFMVKWLKTLANSLFGKFAQMNDINEVTMDMAHAWAEQDKGYKVDTIISNPDEPWRDDPFVIHKGKRPVKHTFRAISGFVAAGCRIILNKALMDNPDAVISCETDSIKVKVDCELKGIEIDSAKVGKWKVIDISEQVLGCKATLKNNPDGTQLYHVKGVGKKEQKVEAIGEDCHEVSFIKPVRNKEAERHKVRDNTWLRVKKRINLSDTKRQWYNDGSSMPLFISNLGYKPLLPIGISP